MKIQDLSTNIKYQKEYDILKHHLCKDFQNIVFNIAINDCDYFPRFTIFDASVFIKKYIGGYDYWMYVGTYTDNESPHIVLMNIFKEQEHILSNKLYIIKINSNLYVDNALIFKEFKQGICGFKTIAPFDLIFYKTILSLNNF